jgi:DNA-binding response OmpR family regulator
MIKKKILVVEKDESILQLIGHVLNDSDYDVKLSLTEDGIFDQIIRFLPDAIIIDIIKITPEGTQLCRDIKEAEGLNHIPVIVLSTHMKADLVKEICADEVIHKPFDIDLLLETIEKQFENSENTA